MGFTLKNSNDTTLYTFNDTFKRVDGDHIEIRVKGKGKAWAHGGLMTGDRMLDPKFVTMEGYIAEGTAALTDAEMFSMIAALYDQDLRLYRPAGDYYLPVKSLVKLLKKPVKGQFGVAWQVMLEWMLADPFWYSPTESSDTESVVSVPKTWTVNVPSPVNWEISPRIEVVSTSSLAAGFTLLNNTNNQRFQYTDSNFTGGQTLEVDCKEGTVELDGVSSIENFSGSFITLEPGNNSITMAGAGGPLTSVVFNWYPRFL